MIAGSHTDDEAGTGGRPSGGDLFRRYDEKDTTARPCPVRKRYRLGVQVRRCGSFAAAKVHLENNVAPGATFGFPSGMHCRMGCFLFLSANEEETRTGEKALDCQQSRNYLAWQICFGCGLRISSCSADAYEQDGRSSPHQWVKKGTEPCALPRGVYCHLYDVYCSFHSAVSVYVV